ncbi:isocitrate lyase/PEP mutase family protein [Mycobacteroides franklinii]|uniref:2,3-dimethylmalate lyase n=1 Tax=Mycobacteroides franklinii TaxID=948102 RepID=A0A4R8QXH7_9MYCO|nr:isocitrate lyase/PEP mutase family protein [Mycobacteroides franklinii]ORA58665.1 carboxyvinyl-carboxyphosphonate phosphorylmutase [Mycobacteroides franklinii]TDH24723.1 isocitrate lyase/PEP mutase family protein [Mycobacteroides franklinii]TDZ45106.1 2,3-dimethylmalate lyase [Mycobacteroides franklinii]TDZ48596.1 2,3-dimethylmalate lyase [Mycobacteroides franklinii]TDZ58776.1 2,3-dimethylmalate lyase [Mycobacteroides franklinii]
MTAAATLKDLIQSPEIVVMPGVFDPFSARLAERAGFPALQCSGAAISGVHFGRPDYSLISMEDMVACTARIVRSVRVPVMADGDNGFGNAVNTHYTVRAFEEAGAAGVNLEDQVTPKRCGHLDGKHILDLEEAAVKVRAAAEARTDPDFVINARTDALAVEGIAGAIRRGNAYLEAGATMIFVEGVTSRDEIRAAVAGIDGPVAVNVIEGGKSPHHLTFRELQNLGVARVSLPGALLMSALGGMRNALERIQADGGTADLDDLFLPFREAHDLIGMREIESLERRYLA